MPLRTCPSCRRLTPSVSVSCIHCGTLPPDCPDCTGTGRCPACDGDVLAGCRPCNHTGRCPHCEGRGRRWPTPPKQAVTTTHPPQ